jgi:N-acetylglutamate synthase-like GNAT family acetyltransferase
MQMTIQSLDPSAAERVRQWTFPAYRHLLTLQEGVRYPRRGDWRRVRPYAFTASDAEGHAGLVLGCIPLNVAANATDTQNEAELLSLYVTPAMRDRGIGGRLVATLETAVRNAGFSRVTAVYMTGAPEIPFLERLFEHRGWSAPEVRMQVLKAPLEQALRAQWYSRYELRSGFELVPWEKVGPDDIARLRASHEARRWIAEDLVPWSYNMKDIEPASSIGVRLNGDLVGWVINHRMSPDTVRFTCAFIHPDLGRRARLIPAISESIRRAVDAGYRYLTLTVPADHPEMTRFAQRWCAPLASFHGETRGTFKDLVTCVPGGEQ